ncbi:MAG: hypothetical protein HY928_01285 [Elusimicrobia bacterium]|nr:hypothetical protein [Elusimicrobiota bacterium]
MNYALRRLLPCLLLLAAGCGKPWTVVARHELSGGAPEKTRAAYLADFKSIMAQGVNLEKSGFRYARMEGGYTVDIQEDAFTLTYRPYLSIVSTTTREKRTRCAYKDLPELRVLEFGASRGAGFLYEVVLGNACGGLSLWGSTKERMVELANTLLMLKRYEGGAPQASEGPAPQKI